MKQYNITEAKSRLSELVNLALQGEDIVIARNNKPLVRLAPVSAMGKKQRPGSANGQILSVSHDFDELLKDFKEYL
jgi:prevent-host-death family protein